MYEKEFGEEVEKVIASINDSIDEYMVDRSAADWKEKNMPFSIKDFSECVHHTKNATSLIINHFTKAINDFTYNGELFITHKDEEQTETLQLEDQFNTKENEGLTGKIKVLSSEEIIDETTEKTEESSKETKEDIDDI
jgi:hypothetical protein